MKTVRFIQVKNIFLHIVIVIASAFFCAFIFSCNNNAGSKNEGKNSTVSTKTVKKRAAKPPGTYSDTLMINAAAAVFYQPDPVQLAKIKEVTDSAVFDGEMHEYFYEMRNARMVIRKTWLSLSIIESEKNRYLMFIKKDKTNECIDLDMRNDSHGLFIFDGKKSPLPIDMTNLETGISFYLKK